MVHSKNMAKTKTNTVVDSLTSGLGSVASLLVHTLLFAGSFTLAIFGIAPWDTVLLAVTTIVSLEAIYLAILIQISVNRAKESLEEVEEGVAEIENDIAEIEEGIDEIGEDIEGIEKDVAEIEEDLGEVSEDIEELQEDIEELAEEEDKDQKRKQTQEVTLTHISATLQKLIEDVERLKK